MMSCRKFFLLLILATLLNFFEYILYAAGCILDLIGSIRWTHGSITAAIVIACGLFSFFGELYLDWKEERDENNQ